MQIHDDITESVLARAHIDGNGKQFRLLSELHLHGLFRIVRIADDISTAEDLLGDTYKPEVNTDIAPDVLKRQRRAEVARIAREGVYGTIAQVRELSRDEWTDLPDCALWGTIGRDFIGSGYDGDFLRVADAWAQEHRQQFLRFLKTSIYRVELGE